MFHSKEMYVGKGFVKYVQICVHVQSLLFARSLFCKYVSVKMKLLLIFMSTNSVLALFKMHYPEIPYSFHGPYLSLTWVQ